MAAPCQAARYKLASYVASLSTSDAAFQASSMYKAALIGTPKTMLTQVAGNAPFAVLRMAQSPLRAAYDVGESFLKSVSTGMKVSPREFREVANTLTTGGVQAFGHGFAAGVGDSANAVKQSIAAGRALAPGTPFGERISAAMDEMSAHLQNPALQGKVLEGRGAITNPYMRVLVEGAFAAMEAMDKPFYEGAAQMSLYAQGKVNAIRQGLQGAALDKEIARLVANPTDEMQLRAVADANFATFKDKNKIAQGAEAFRHTFARAIEAEPEIASAWGNMVARAKRIGGRAGLAAMDLTIPFTGVPTSVAGKYLSLTPLGALDVQKWLGGQESRSLAFANTVMGVGGMALGYDLYNRGVLTGQVSQSPGLRDDQAKAAGIPANALKIGNDWVVLTKLGPPVAGILMGASLAEMHKQKPEAGVPEQGAAMAASAGRSLLDNTFLQNAKQTLDAIQDPQSKSASFIASLIPVPSALAQTARLVDPTPHETRTIAQRVQNKLPFASMLLPRGQGPLGDLPDRPWTERIGDALSPVQIRESRDTPALAELRRLGIAIGMPERQTGVGGKSVAIPDDEYRAMVNRQGADLNAMLTDIMTGPETGAEYQSLSDDEKRHVLKRFLSNKRDDARGTTRANIAALLQPR